MAVCLKKNKIQVGFSLEEVVMAAMAREDVVAISREDELVMEWIVIIINCANREKEENLNLKKLDLSLLINCLQSMRKNTLHLMH